MGVKKPLETISQYWAGVDDRINALATFVGLLNTTIVAIPILILRPQLFFFPWFWISALIVTIIQIIINAIVMQYLARPFRDILAAASKVAGEKNTYLIPPNLNNKKYKDTGFSTAVNLLYESVRQAKQEKTSEAESDGIESLEVIVGGLDRLSSEIIIVDSEQNIIFNTPKAPIEKAPNDKIKFNLLFDGADNLENWIQDCSINAVNAEKTWTRIPDNISGSEDRRLFDVYANYKKDSPNETIVTLIDRTDSYAKDEEDFDFISFAAHELRGPITVIRGYIDVLYEELEEKLVDDQEGLFSRLEVSASRLSGHINNILNASRYDRRHLRMNLSEKDLSKIYSDISEDMDLRASLQNRLLEVSIPESLPTIAADRYSLIEVITNLVDNAIKYSHEGGLISISAKHVGDFVELSIVDRGIGMPSNVLENIFKKFYRSHRSRETVSGTGIGLYISKAIIEAHGGAISVRSAEEKGSTFTISIPTFSSVKSKIKNTENKDISSEGSGWIKNHGMYRG